jgi:threonine synthase
VKEEGSNPTGSFKARGMAVAVPMAKRLGATAVAAPSAGNAGSALAAYAARVGLPAHVFMPDDVPEIFVRECEALGAAVVLVPGRITDAGREMAARREREGWFDVSTLKEPYRVEGKKTMAYEILEELAGEVPDVFVYPTGGGTGIVGMARAFEEMRALGWLDAPPPRLVCVQAAGCAPIVRAFREGASRAEPWERAETHALGLRVPSAIGDFLILRAIRETGGTAVAVEEEEIRSARAELSRATGVYACPEGAATWAALLRLRASGDVSPDDRVVLFQTGTGLKYPEIPVPERPA